MLHWAKHLFGHLIIDMFIDFSIGGVQQRIEGDLLNFLHQLIYPLVNHYQGPHQKIFANCN